MSVLSDRDIRRAIESGELVITPTPREIQPCSVDLRLGPHLMSFRDTSGPSLIFPWVDNSDLLEDHDLTQLLDQMTQIEPGEFILAHTIEHVNLPTGLTARVEGKSSLGRLGLAIHCTAGWIDPGFTGQITLELVNHSPHSIMLNAGMPICQLVCERVSSTVERPYGHADLGSRYQHSSGAVGSRYHAGLTDAYPVREGVSPFDGVQMTLPDLDSPLWNTVVDKTFSRSVSAVTTPLPKPVGDLFKVQTYAEVIDSLRAEIEKMQIQTADYRSAHEKAIQRWKDEEIGRLAALKLADEKERALTEITAKYRSMEQQNNAALASANGWEEKSREYAELYKTANAEARSAIDSRDEVNERNIVLREEIDKVQTERDFHRAAADAATNQWKAVSERLANVQIDRNAAQNQLAEWSEVHREMLDKHALVIKQRDTAERQRDAQAALAAEIRREFRKVQGLLGDAEERLERTEHRLANRRTKYKALLKDYQRLAEHVDLAAAPDREAGIVGVAEED